MRESERCLSRERAGASPGLFDLDPPSLERFGHRCGSITVRCGMDGDGLLGPELPRAESSRGTVLLCGTAGGGVPSRVVGLNLACKIKG